MTLLLVLILLVLVCIALARTGELERRVTDLRLRNDHLQGRLDRLTAFPGGTGEARPPAGAPAAPAAAYHPGPPVHHPAPQPPSTAAPSPGRPPAPAVVSRTSREWEALIGEKLLNRVGALTIILATGFFLKYAFAHDWIPPLVRVLLGVAAGAGLVALAGRFRTTLPIFAQGVLGAGLSMLYLSAYASFGFYHLIPLPAAFVAMSLVTAVVLERAFRFDSLPVALLGWAGGFLTPLVLSGGGVGAGSAGGLFLYLLLLTGALAAMAWRRPRWDVLEPFTLAGACAGYGLWRIASAPGGVAAGTEIGLPLAFLTGVWAVFFALDVLRAAGDGPARRHDVGHHVWSSAVGALYLVAAAELMTPVFAGWVALLTALAALAYVVPVVVLRRRMPSFTLKGVALLATATALQFDGYPLAVALSLEAAALVATGVLLRAAHVRYAALALMGIGLCASVLLPSTFAQPLPYAPGASGRSWSLALQAAALGAAAWSYRRALSRPDDSLPEARAVEQALHLGWAIVLLLLLASVETRTSSAWSPGPPSPATRRPSPSSRSGRPSERRRGGSGPGRSSPACWRGA